MTEPAPEDVTQLLQAWSAGEPGALEKLTPLVYRELHRLAKRYMAQERSGHTLQTTALVNEAYLRLVGSSQVACATPMTTSPRRKGGSSGDAGEPPPFAHRGGTP